MNLLKNIILVMILSMAGLNQWAQAKDGPSDLEVVPYLDLERYQGQWYEVARLPNSFQKKCLSSKAFYQLKSSQEAVEVLNICTRENGEEKSAKGVAKVVDHATNSKLEVRFNNWFSKLFPWLTKGDYWVLAIGDNYEYSLVGTPSRKYLWILSRTKILEENKMKELITRAKDLGFDTEKLIFSHP